MRSEASLSFLEDRAKTVRKRLLEMVVAAGKGSSWWRAVLGGPIGCLVSRRIAEGRPGQPKLAGSGPFRIQQRARRRSAVRRIGRLRFFRRVSAVYLWAKRQSAWGHVDRAVPGIEASTGSLGHGLGIGVGMALAARKQGEPYCTVVMLGDGECYEGSVWEAAMLAAQHRLSRLVAIVDRNRQITLDFTEDCNRLEPFADKWRAFGWEVAVINGHSFEEIIGALDGIRSRNDGPPHRDSRGYQKGQRDIVHGRPARLAPWRSERRALAAGADGPRSVNMGQSVDVRDAFFEQLHRIATADSAVVVLTDDMGAFALDALKKLLPEQYFNVGIAEQNLISVAAGMAMSGLKPFVYGIANFVTLRCYEQIKVNLSAMNLPVTIVGSGPGYTYGSDGPTHHGIQDVAVMRALPNLSIYSPCDSVSTAAVARLAYEGDGPQYVRLEKGVLPVLYSGDEVFSNGFAVVESGVDTMILSAGRLVHNCKEVVRELGSRSIDSGCIDLFRIKPLDVTSLLSSIRHVKRLVTVEEHSVIGGIGSLMSDLLADAGLQIPLRRIGLSDAHQLEYGSRDWLLERSRLDLASLVNQIEEWATT